VVYLYGFEGYSRGVFAINALALTLLIVGSRVSFRMIGEVAARYGAGRGAGLAGEGEALGRERAVVVRERAGT
jgi:hypothetical protein